MVIYHAEALERYHGDFCTCDDPECDFRSLGARFLYELGWSPNVRSLVDSTSATGQTNQGSRKTSASESDQ